MTRFSVGFSECPVCEGSGFDPKVLSQLPVECPKCKGKGKITATINTEFAKQLKAAAAKIGR